MTDPEIRLKCMEMALTQVARESPSDKNFLDRVAEVQTWFYDRINVKEAPEMTPRPDPDPPKRQGQKDKPGLIT